MDLLKRFQGNDDVQEGVARLKRGLLNVVGGLLDELAGVQAEPEPEPRQPPEVVVYGPPKPPVSRVPNPIRRTP